MSGIVVNIKRCKRCKNIYDVNLHKVRCPYCSYMPVPIYIPVPMDKKKPHIPSWPF